MKTASMGASPRRSMRHGNLGREPAPEKSEHIVNELKQLFPDDGIVKEILKFACDLAFSHAAAKFARVTHQLVPLLGEYESCKIKLDALEKIRKSLEHCSTAFVDPLFESLHRISDDDDDDNDDVDATSERTQEDLEKRVEEMVSRLYGDALSELCDANYRAKTTEVEEEKGEEEEEGAE